MQVTNAFVMHLRAIRRVAQVARPALSIAHTRCLCSSTVHIMPSKVLLAAKPETYIQQIGEKRKRIQELFAKFDPPELQVFESEKQNYRMR